MDAQIAWIELGSPTEPGMYRFGSKLVNVRTEDIRQASDAIARGLSPIFNAVWVETDSGGAPHYELSGLV